MPTMAEGTRITVVRGDLTRQDVDVIVNAANEHLMHGGGVAAAIVRAGGHVIQDESDAWVAAHGPLRPGQAAVTTGGTLAARHVVHVAGPRYGTTGDDRAALALAVTAALDAAAGVSARSVALPAISAGIFGYPLAEAAAGIVDAVTAWIEEHPETLDEVRLVGFSDEVVGAFARALEAARG